jgi:hypothetical protein
LGRDRRRVIRLSDLIPGVFRLRPFILQELSRAAERMTGHSFRSAMDHRFSRGVF